MVPLFGSHRGRQVLPAVAAAWLAQDVACEILVATAGAIPLALPAGPTEGVVSVIAAGASATTPGILRNLAASRARGRRLYLTDADVLPLGRGFLRRAIALAGPDALCQPYLYRLLGPLPLPGAVLRPPSTPGCFVLARPDGRLEPAVGERFRTRHPGGPLADDEVLAVLPPPDQLRSGLPERRQWLATFHWGGVLLERWLFAEVGGYCPRYSGWGSEDDDLLVKLAGRGPVVRAWKADPALACLHVEHERPDLDAAQAVANRSLFAARQASGAEAMAREDRAAWAAGQDPPAG